MTGGVAAVGFEAAEAVARLVGALVLLTAT